MTVGIGRPTTGSTRPATPAREPERVCRAWHVTMSVQVRQPGFRRAEG